ncbi:hypothetical protein I315_05592 [Cryptococcus gattii Ru294]|nr:hypothetical protein I315_05592 [Cryptococcus gattii Ru294]
MLSAVWNNNIHLLIDSFQNHLLLSYDRHQIISTNAPMTPRQHTLIKFALLRKDLSKQTMQKLNVYLSSFHLELVKEVINSSVALFNKPDIGRADSLEDAFGFG